MREKLIGDYIFCDQHQTEAESSYFSRGFDDSLPEIERPWLSGYVYFVGGGKSGLIKIGYANDTKKRLAGLQVGSPEILSLLAEIKVPHNIEKWLHKLFAEDRRHGEWFQETSRLIAVIDAAKTGNLAMFFETVNREFRGSQRRA